MIIGITGHRPQLLGGFKIPNPTYNYVNQELRKIIEELKPELVLTGMALGVDQWMAELCVELHIPFNAIVPFVGQESMWPMESRIRYNQLLNLANEVVIVSEGKYSAWKMQKRNQFIVDHSDMLVAVSTGNPGGTENCISYALSVGKRIMVIMVISPN